MTNAEKIAKDTDFLVELLSRYNCGGLKCTECPINKKLGKCKFDKEDFSEYLESEADEK